MGILVSAGSLIPLYAQLTSGETDKVIKATVRRLDGVIVGSEVTLVHTQNGEYKDTSINYPAGITHCIAQYTVFDADGVTLNTTGEQFVSDIFELNESIATVEIIHPSAFIEGVVYEENNIEGVINNPGNLAGEIQDDDTNITGIIDTDDENIAGIVQKEDNDIIGILEEWWKN